MAKKFIFTKNLVDIKGSLYRIAASDEEMNVLNINPSDQKIITVTDQEFSDVQKGIKNVLSYNASDVITFETNSDRSIDNEDVFLTEQENLLKILDNVIDKGHDSTFNANWITYRAAVAALDPRDTDTYTYPIAKTIEEVLADNGTTIYSPLQLPA